MGLQNIISEFGMNHSSIGYLGELALDNLKIDRGLVSNAAQNAPIINASVKMAHGIKLRVVADGVETEEQVNLLRKQKCAEIQQKTGVSEREIRQLFGKK